MQELLVPGLSGLSGPHPTRARRALALAAPALGALALAAGWVLRVEVRGPSMLPELAPGDRLLALRGHWGLRPGVLVVARHPRDRSQILVKRVAKAAGSELILLGDNPGASTDSRDFGPVPRSLVLGRVFYRYAPATRAGRL